MVVANARKVRLIYETDRKNDRLDARMLARLGRVDASLLAPVQHRSVEAQGKNGESKIMRNLARYYGYFNSDRCEKEWANFRKFRVIVVQRNSQRRANLLKALAPRYAHRMFWLTTEELYRRDIGGMIFLAPRDYDTNSYSFP